jgi:hypothetical protein
MVGQSRSKSSLPPVSLQCACRIVRKGGVNRVSGEYPGGRWAAWFEYEYAIRV